jgi:hypothetical protein
VKSMRPVVASVVVGLFLLLTGVSLAALSVDVFSGLPEIAVKTEASPADLGSAPPAGLPGNKWTYTPDAARPAALSDAHIDVALPGFRDKMAFSSPESALAILTQDAGIRNQPCSTFSLLDLKTNAVRKSWRIGQPVSLPSPYAISPKGTRAVLTGPGLGRGDFPVGHIEVLDLTADPPRSIYSGEPFGAMGKRDAALGFAALVSEDILLASDDANSIERRYVGWKLPEMKPIYSFKPKSGHTGICVDLTHTPALSANRKTIVLEDNWGLYFYDTATGNPAGTIDFPVVVGPYTASTCANSFSPDGKFLLHTHSFGMSMFSLEETPKLLWTRTKPQGMQNEVTVGMGVVEWVAPNYLLLKQKYLYDIEKQVIVWQYDVPAFTTTYVAAGRYWLVRDEYTTRMASAKSGEPYIKHTLIDSVELPARQVLDAVARVDPATMYAIKPGDKVSVSVTIKDEKLRQALTDYFSKQLRDNGMVVADGQPIKLVVSESALRPLETEYRGVITGATAKVRMEAMMATVEFTVEDRPIWIQQMPVGAPGQITLTKGMPADPAAVAGQAGIIDQGFRSIVLPKQVPAFRDPAGYGRSDLAPKPAKP